MVIEDDGTAGGDENVQKAPATAEDEGKARRDALYRVFVETENSERELRFWLHRELLLREEFWRPETITLGEDDDDGEDDGDEEANEAFQDTRQASLSDAIAGDFLEQELAASRAESVVLFDDIAPFLVDFTVSE